jgi:CO/xanthine dehydrogenase FAD-binding subunit
MRIPCKEYILAHTVEETLDALSAAQGAGCILSGGSDLLLELQQGTHPAVAILVDVSEVDELCLLEIRGGSLFIGASVTLTRLANSALIKEHAEALSDAATLMANPQVCNVATIGGNVAHALPAADGTIALLALEAEAVVATKDSRLRVPIQSLFKGPGISTLEGGKDLLVGFYLPLRGKGQASAFARRVNPQGIALAMLNLAVWLEREGERIIETRIAIGPAGPIPRRMQMAEKALAGYIYSSSLLESAKNEVLMEAHFRSSPHRATAEYRRHLAEILLTEAFSEAWQRAQRLVSP